MSPLTNVNVKQRWRSLTWNQVLKAGGWDLLVCWATNQICTNLVRLAVQPLKIHGRHWPTTRSSWKRTMVAIWSCHSATYMNLKMRSLAKMSISRWSYLDMIIILWIEWWMALEFWNLVLMRTMPSNSTSFGIPRIHGLGLKQLAASIYTFLFSFFFKLCTLW